MKPQVAQEPLQTVPLDKVEADPDWIAELREKAREKLVPYAELLRGLCLSPVRFGREWASGERRALNPFLFMAAAIGVITLSSKVVSDLVGEHESVYDSLLSSVMPQLYYGAFGTIAHLVLWPMGARRRWRTSVGLALYAGGGPATLAALLLSWVLTILRLFGRMPEPGLIHAQIPEWFRVVLLLLTASSVLSFYVVLCLALSGAHQLSVWKVVLGMIASTLILGAFFGAVGVGTYREIPGVIAPRLIFSEGRLRPLI